MPRREPRVHTVVHAGRGFPLEKAPGRGRDVDHVGGGDRAVVERAHGAASADVRAHPVDRAPAFGVSEEAFDAQDEVPRRPARVPFAEELRGAVDAAGVGPVRLAVRRRRGAVEHEIGREVQERRAGAAAGLGERAHGEGVHGKRGFRILLGFLDAEGRGVHDRLRAKLDEALENLLALRQVQGRAGQGRDLVPAPAQLAHDDLAELASGTGHENAKRHARA